MYTKKELYEKAINLGYDGEYPLFKGIFIIQQRKLHDSGYRMMYVIGHTDYDEKEKDFHYYLIGTYSDVIDFERHYTQILKNDAGLLDLHLDISRNGIIHIWTNSKSQRLKVYMPQCSSCMLNPVTI